MTDINLQGDYTGYFHDPQGNKQAFSIGLKQDGVKLHGRFSDGFVMGEVKSGFIEVDETEIRVIFHVWVNTGILETFDYDFSGSVQPGGNSIEGDYRKGGLKDYYDTMGTFHLSPGEGSLPKVPIGDLGAGTLPLFRRARLDAGESQILQDLEKIANQPFIRTALLNNFSKMSFMACDGHVTHLSLHESQITTFLE